MLDPKTLEGFPLNDMNKVTINIILEAGIKTKTGMYKHHRHKPNDNNITRLLKITKT